MVKWIADHFMQFQIAFVIMVLLIWRIMKSGPSETGFKSREANRKDLDQLLKDKSSSAQSKIKKKSPTPILGLPGITLNGEPHEILGVARNAAETEILRAYKEKIKLFHPDRIQGQAREQIRFYEEASAKINQAKETMLQKLKNPD